MSAIYTQLPECQPPAGNFVSPFNGRAGKLNTDKFDFSTRLKAAAIFSAARGYFKGQAGGH
jgi:hypothetical protein